MNWGHLTQGSATSQHFGGSSRTCPKRSSPFWRRCSLARTASPRPVLLSYGWRAWPARSPVPSTSCQDQSPLWAQPVHIHHPAGSSSARWGGEQPHFLPVTPSQSWPLPMEEHPCQESGQQRALHWKGGSCSANNSSGSSVQPYWAAPIRMCSCSPAASSLPPPPPPFHNKSIMAWLHPTCWGKGAKWQGGGEGRKRAAPSP